MFLCRTACAQSNRSYGALERLDRTTGRQDRVVWPEQRIGSGRDLASESMSDGSCNN